MYLPKPIHASVSANPYRLTACPMKLSHGGHRSVRLVVVVAKPVLRSDLRHRLRPDDGPRLRSVQTWELTSSAAGWSQRSRFTTSLNGLRCTGPCLPLGQPTTMCPATIQSS